VNTAKGFLIVFAAVYVVLAGAGLAIWGGPDYSAEYMDRFKDDHERFLSITKSTNYKKYMQQGEAAPENETLGAQKAFVAEYTSRSEYIAEEQRRGMRQTYFGILNATALVLIAIRFGRAPMMQFLDAQIAEVRARLEEAANAKAEAAKRLEEAQTRLAGLKADEEQAKAYAAELIERERAALEEGTKNALSFIDDETADRKRIAALQAAKTIRRELVEKAAAAVAEEYVRNRTADTEAEQTAAFISALTGQPAQESVAK
jgi:F0F1-type ATP synthase membrane subunit b/b'